MNRPDPTITRRQILKLAGSAGLLGAAPGSLLALAGRAAHGAEDRRLILLFLEGGNDGLNTVVPLEDDRYHEARPRIGIPAGSLVRLDEDNGLHPALAPWQALYEEGRLAVLRGVGYERPDRSHFVSRDIWHAGRRDPGRTPTGWLGRALETARDGSLPAVALGAEEAPLILRGRTRSGLTLSTLDDFQLDLPEGERAARLDALEAGVAASDTPVTRRIAELARDSYATAEKLRRSIDRIPAGGGYPASSLGERLQLAARLVRAEGGPPALWTALPGFDTHAVQPGTHAALLQQLGQATAAFLADLARDGADARTLVLVYSEFGRRVRENGSQGTDHGAAGPVFALGGALRGGLYGAAPDLDDLLEGDLPPRTDFRAVFREAAGDWMGWDTRELFDRELPPVGFVG